MKHLNHSHHTRTHTTLNMNTSFVKNDRCNHSRICTLTAPTLYVYIEQKIAQKKKKTRRRRRREIENCGISVFQPIMISYLVGVIRVFVCNQIKIAFAQRKTHKEDAGKTER